MSHEKWVSQAGEHANQIIVLVEGRRTDELAQAIGKMTPDEVVLAAFAVADALLEQERVNEGMRERMGILERGSKELFEDRARLTARLTEAREIRDAQAKRIEELRVAI